MKRTLSNNLHTAIGQNVKVKGWMNSYRDLGKLGFLVVRDRSGLIQVVLDASQKELMKKLKQLYPGSVLEVTGLVQKSQDRYEIVDASVAVVSAVKEPPVIEYYKPEIPSDLEFILDHRPVSLRNRQIQAVFKIQAELVHAYRLFMHDHVGAVEYFGPNIIGSSSEGGAEFFTVDYFNYTATLAQSSQLYKQIMVGVNERVFALMPFFRAEKSNTVRHLSEGKQFEFEMGFFDDWTEVMDIQESCIKAMWTHVQKVCQDDLASLGTTVVKIPSDVSIPRLTFHEAQEIYFKRTGIDERLELDLSPACEKELCKWSSEEHGTDLVFVTDWSKEKRPFYSYVSESDRSLTNTFDLLCAGSEITSGGQRCHTYESIVAGIEDKGMDPHNFEDYLSVFASGMPPHGGFGMGLERLTMTLLGLNNIREASLFPSDTKRIAGKKMRLKMYYGQENIRGEIIRLLKDFPSDYEHLVHEPTETSSESSSTRETPLDQGIKALIVKGKKSKKNYQFNIPADQMLDMKKVSAIVQEKCEMEKPDVIFERFGLKIGGIPPFGYLVGIDTYYDETIQTKSVSAFNCGFLEESIIMPTQDLIAIVDPTFVSVCKS